MRKHFHRGKGGLNAAKAVLFAIRLNRRKRRLFLAGRAALSLTIGISLLGCLETFAGDSVKGSATTPDTNDTRLLSFANETLVFDLEERLRFEARNNNRDFDDSINDLNDDSWLLNRFRLGVAVQPARWLKLYGQFQDAREWDSDRPNIPGVQGNEGGDADLRQAYVELGNRKLFPVMLTVGRQPLSYGDRRLVADSVWSNLGRTFDAVKVRFENERFWVDAFWGRPVQIKEHVFNDSDAADNVAGVYGSTGAIGPQTTDLYVFYRDKADIQPDLDPTNTFDPRGAFLGPAQRITTIGTRSKSKAGALHGWDYGMEVAYQWGEVWSGDRTTPHLDHHAFAAHFEAGYTIERASWRPRLGLEYNYATGDDDPSDRKSHSFQNLYASNHEKYGYMDEFSWRNLHDARLQMNVRPSKKIDVELSYHAFWLADTNDYWFRANGYSSLRTRTVDGRDVRTLGAGNFAGHELDFVVKWKTTKWMNIDFGYCHFFPGNYLKDTGPGDDADFGYVQMLLAF